MKRTLFILMLTVLVGACSSNSDTSGNTTDDNFDRSKILVNVADNILIPAFKNFKNKLTVLKEKATEFTNTPETTTLNGARTAWNEAYKAWQQVAMFNIGKAEELEFTNFFNIYPLTSADVEANITNGTYDLNNPNNHDAQGFPALDYLFFGIGNNETEILEKYTTNANAAGYKKYVSEVVAKMNEVTTQIINNWESGYRDAFVKSTGNTATSSFNKFVNDYIYFYERRLRAEKIGIPAGNFSGGSVLPEKVEAFYKKTISKELILEALKAMKNVFNGAHYGTGATGTGFKAYLEALNKSDLAVKINNQLVTAITEIEGLDANFYQQIQTNNAKMTKAYDELQKVVVLLKVSMLQAFNVNVDYVDADGD